MDRSPRLSAGLITATTRHPSAPFTTSSHAAAVAQFPGHSPALRNPSARMKSIHQAASHCPLGSEVGVHPAGHRMRYRRPGHCRRTSIRHDLPWRPRRRNGEHAAAAAAREVRGVKRVLWERPRRPPSSSTCCSNHYTDQRAEAYRACQRCCRRGTGLLPYSR